MLFGNKCVVLRLTRPHTTHFLPLWHFKICVNVKSLQTGQLKYTLLVSRQTHFRSTQRGETKCSCTCCTVASPVVRIMRWKVKCGWNNTFVSQLRGLCVRGEENPTSGGRAVTHRLVVKFPGSWNNDATPESRHRQRPSVKWASGRDCNTSPFVAGASPTGGTCKPLKVKFIGMDFVLLLVHWISVTKQAGRGKWGCSESELFAVTHSIYPCKPS